MNARQAAWQAGLDASEVLGPEGGLFARVDPADLGRSVLGGTVRYVLSSGGHIAGIVNPPGPKAWYEVGEYHAGTPAQWREVADRHDGSWWEDWARWTDTRAGRLIQPPPMGGDRHPALGAAPGDYVRG
jgi:polyhydroxyalkanoate synthase